MKKTALAIITSVMQRYNVTNVPTALVGETDPNTLQLMELVYAVCEELRQARCWTVQKRKHTFDTVADTTRYMLPADYYSPTLGTYYNNDTDERLIGPISDAEFASYAEGGNTPSRNYYYRLSGWDNNTASGLGQFEITPTPSSAEELSFEYITRHLFLPVDYALATAYSADALVNVSGEIYKCGAGGITASDTVPTGKTTGIVDDDGTWDWYNTPIEVLQADTDLVLFDYDLVKLGVRAKWSGEKRGDIYSEQAAAEFKSKIDQAVNRYRGSYVGSFSRRRGGPNLTIPYKSWDI